MKNNYICDVTYHSETTTVEYQSESPAGSYDNHQDALRKWRETTGRTDSPFIAYVSNARIAKEK